MNPGTIINATPYDLPGMLRAAYVSSHWYEEGPEPTVEARLARKLRANPAWAYLIDSEKARDQRRSDTLLAVLKTVANTMPHATRIVYDSQRRVAYPHQRDDVAAVLQRRLNDPNELAAYKLTDYVAHDLYLMGIVPAGNRANVNGATSFEVDHAATLRQFPEHLELNAEAMLDAETATGVPHLACVHERFSTAKGCGTNVWQHPSMTWKPYIRQVNQQWPDRAIAWWSGSMRSNPGRETPGKGDFWIDPPEKQIRTYGAEALGALA